MDAGGITGAEWRVCKRCRSDRRRGRLHRCAGRKHRLQLLGEFHGTREIPRLVTALVERESARGPVLLGLEIPHGEQASLQAYLDSDGDGAARRALRQRPWWTRSDDQHDGRRSEDMLALIESIRRLRASGRDVALLAYDVPPDAPRTDQDMRDASMARRIRAAHAALPGGYVVVLAGNVHAMLERPADAPPQMPQSMGSHLRDLSPMSIRITAREGAFWACPGGKGCGPSSADGHDARTGPSDGAYNYLVVLPRFTVAQLIGMPASAP